MSYSTNKLTNTTQEINNQTTNTKNIHHTTSDFDPTKHPPRGVFSSSDWVFPWRKSSIYFEQETKFLDNLKAMFHKENDYRKEDLHKLHHNKKNVKSCAFGKERVS